MPKELEVLRAALRSNPEHHAKLRQLVESGAIGSECNLPDDGPLTIVAAPEHFNIEGSQQARCACGVILWISPSTQEMIKRRGAIPQVVRVICAWCFSAELKEARSAERPQ